MGFPRWILEIRLDMPQKPKFAIRCFVNTDMPGLGGKEARRGPETTRVDGGNYHVK
jgi:hypothetical protein